MFWILFTTLGILLIFLVLIIFCKKKQSPPPPATPIPRKKSDHPIFHSVWIGGDTLIQKYIDKAQYIILSPVLPNVLTPNIQDKNKGGVFQFIFVDITGIRSQNILLHIGGRYTIENHWKKFCSFRIHQWTQFFKALPSIHGIVWEIDLHSKHIFTLEKLSQSIIHKIPNYHIFFRQKETLHKWNSKEKIWICSFVNLESPINHKLLEKCKHDKHKISLSCENGVGKPNHHYHLLLDSIFN